MAIVGSVAGLAVIVITDCYVQSDSWSCRSCAPALNAGMDHEMPDAKWLNESNVKAALADTSLEIQPVDRALTRRYTQMFRFGQFDRRYQPGQIDAQATAPNHVGSDPRLLCCSRTTTRCYHRTPSRVDRHRSPADHRDQRRLLSRQLISSATPGPGGHRQ